MRVLRVVVALAFGLAMAGPGTPDCNHHQDHPGHHGGTRGTVPQACCPAAIGASVPTANATWRAAPLPVLAVEIEAGRPGVLPARTHILPFALAPPPLLA